MRDFRAVDRFYQTVHIVDGPTTRASIQRAPDSTSLSDQFLSAKQILRVRHDNLVKTGDVIRLGGGSFHLVGDHSETLDWRTHILLNCDRQVPWTRAMTTLDPVTGLQRSSGEPTSLGMPWVYWERALKAPVDRVTQLPNIDFVVVTGSPVLPGDLIAGRTILRHDVALGLTVLGIKE